MAGKIYELRITYRSEKPLRIGGVEWDIEKETPKAIYVSREKGGYKDKIKKSDLGKTENRFGNNISDLRFTCWCREEDFDKVRVSFRETFFKFVSQVQVDLKAVLAGISKHGWDLNDKTKGQKNDE